jgi:hypothetical protein
MTSQLRSKHSGNFAFSEPQQTAINPHLENGYVLEGLSIGRPKGQFDAQQEISRKEIPAFTRKIK